MALAAFLLLFDIAMRRLALGMSDLRRGWAAITDRLRSRRAQLELEPRRQARLQALFEAKERAARRAEEIPPVAMKTDIQPTEIEVPIRADEAAASDSDRAEPSPAEERPEPGSTAAKLLALKQKKRSGKDDS